MFCKRAYTAEKSNSNCSFPGIFSKLVNKKTFIADFEKPITLATIAGQAHRGASDEGDTVSGHSDSHNEKYSLLNSTTNIEEGSAQELSDSSDFDDNALQSFFQDKDAMSLQTFDYDDEEENHHQINSQDFQDVRIKVEEMFGSIKDDEWRVLRDQKLRKIGKIRMVGLNGWVWCIPGRKGSKGMHGVDFIRDGYDLKLFAATHLGWAGDERFLREKDERSDVRRGDTKSKESESKDGILRPSKRKLVDNSSVCL